MKTLTVRLPEPLVANITAESQARRISKSDVVRERLEYGSRRSKGESELPRSIADLIGAVYGLPRDLSSRAKRQLRRRGYGKNRSR